MKNYFKKKKISFKMLVGIFGFIIFFLLLLGIGAIYCFKDSYSVESHIDDVKESKKKDTELYHTIGWISVEGTDLNMPVYQLHENKAPVNKEKYSWNVFNDGKFHNKMNIMGHNIFNLSSEPVIKDSLFYRFEELMSFVYYDVSKKNQYIQLTIDGKEYVYKIFSVAFLPITEINKFPNGEYTKKEINEQIQLLKKRSIYDYNVGIDSNDKLISLITCTRFFAGESGIEFVVSGRLVRPREFMTHYSVYKNDNYKNIEKILGGGLDEEDVESA